MKTILLLGFLLAGCGGSPFEIADKVPAPNPMSTSEDAGAMAQGDAAKAPNEAMAVVPEADSCPPAMTCIGAYVGLPAGPDCIKIHTGGWCPGSISYICMARETSGPTPGLTCAILKGSDGTPVTPTSDTIAWCCA